MRAPGLSHVPAPPPRASRPPLAIVVAAVLAVLAAGGVAAFGGWSLRGAEEPRGASAANAPVPAEVGPLRLATPSGWTPASRPVLDPVPAGTAAFVPYQGLDAQALISVAPPAGGSLLPAELRSAIKGRLPRPLETRLAGRPAWRYPGLTVTGGRVMDVTLAPTTAGMVTVACVASHSIATMSACATELRLFELRDALWLRPGPDLGFRMRLPDAAQRLNKGRRAARVKMARAKRPRAQARQAGRLEAIYGRAIDRLAGFTPRSGEPARALKAIRGARQSYGRLATAAARRRPATYRRAKRAVTRHERTLKRSLRKIPPLPRPAA